MLVAGWIAVDVQNPFALQIEIDVFLLRPSKQVVPRGNGQLRGVNGVGLVMGQLRHELGEPRPLVPTGFGVKQQRGVPSRDPFHALDQGRPVVPHLSIRGGELPAIGIGSFHARVAVSLKKCDGKALLRQGISRGDTRDATTNDGDVFHEAILSESVKGRRTAPCCTPPPLCWT